MRRWISCVRPDCLPRAASRSLRSDVEPGSIEYSAVTQPRPLPRSHGGTRSSTDAVHSTRVMPNSTSTEPAANSVKSRVNASGAQVVGLAPVTSDAHEVSRVVVATRSQMVVTRPCVARVTPLPNASEPSADRLELVDHAARGG